MTVDHPELDAPARRANDLPLRLPRNHRPLPGPSEQGPSVHRRDLSATARSPAKARTSSAMTAGGTWTSAGTASSSSATGTRRRTAAVVRQMTPTRWPPGCFWSRSPRAPPRRSPAVTPRRLEYVHFVPSGSEATEAAHQAGPGTRPHRLVIHHRRLPRQDHGRAERHRRTLYQTPFRPLLPDLTQVPYGDARRDRDGLAAAPGERLRDRGAGAGRGRRHLPPHGYLRGVAEACDRYGAFLSRRDPDRHGPPRHLVGQPTTRASHRTSCWSARA